MAVLGATILGLACLFYGYCLVYFGRELMRSRKKVTCYGLSSANSRSGPVGVDMPGKVIALRKPQNAPAGRRIGFELAPLAPEGGARVILTYPKSRLTVLPSGTGRLAPKRAAKG